MKGMWGEPDIKDMAKIVACFQKFQKFSCGIFLKFLAGMTDLFLEYP